MKLRLAMVALIVGALAPALSPAAPVEMDTPAAYIIVVRPVDVWSGDRSALSDSLDVVRAKKANYMYRVTIGRMLNGGPLWLQGRSDDPVTNGVADELQRRGFELAHTQDYMFRIDPPTTIEHGKWQEFSDWQSEAFRSQIIGQGDPSKLQGRVSGGKFFGGLTSLATVAVAGAVGGTAGANFVVNSGIAGNGYQATLVMLGSLAAADLPPLDESAFKQIDVRSLFYKGGMIGQIIIAYKEDKTPEAETEALIQGIVSAAGADTTPEDIEHARASDFAFRQQVWADCVAAGKCPGDATTATTPADATTPALGVPDRGGQR